MIVGMAGEVETESVTWLQLRYIIYMYQNFIEQNENKKKSKNLSLILKTRNNKSLIPGWGAVQCWGLATREDNQGFKGVAMSKMTSYTLVDGHTQKNIGSTS